MSDNQYDLIPSIVLSTDKHDKVKEYLIETYFSSCFYRRKSIPEKKSNTKQQTIQNKLSQSDERSNAMLRKSRKITTIQVIQIDI